MPNWDITLVNREDLGITGKARVSVALDIAKRVKGKNLLVICYDKAERYDNIMISKKIILFLQTRSFL